MYYSKIIQQGGHGTTTLYATLAEAAVCSAYNAQIPKYGMNILPRTVALAWGRVGAFPSLP